MLRTIRVIIDIGMHLELTIPADSPRSAPASAGPPSWRRSSSPPTAAPAPRCGRARSSATLGWPGQAIGYKLGERAWLRGRDEARRRHGAGFDLKAWHMKALSQGPFGLDDLTEQLAAL